MMDYKYRNKNWLYENYIEQERSSREIGELCGVSNVTIWYWLKKFDIKIRTLTEATILSYGGKKLYHDGEWLYEQYIVRERTTKQIAKENNVCSATICNWLNKFQIGKVRMYVDKDWLYQKYVVEKLSMVVIGNLCKVTSTPISKWLEEYNIPKRTLTEAAYNKPTVSDKTREKIADIKRGRKRKPFTQETRKNMSERHKGLKFSERRRQNHFGKGNPNWKNGVSFLPYCSKFNQERREETRNHYNRICVISGISALQNNRRLDVDHVNENKTQGCNGVRWLLVPLTRKVHSRMNNSQNHLLLELLLLRNKKAEMNYEFER